jgi:charged multivesicular body protein 7
LIAKKVLRKKEFRELEAVFKDEIPPMQVLVPVSHSNEQAPNGVVESLSHNLSRIKLEVT